MKYVHLKMLEDNRACGEAKKRFMRLFGERAAVTAENVRLWREVSRQEGLGGQDPGYIIWWALRGLAGADVFKEYVQCQLGGEEKVPYLTFRQATVEVGREYDDERCALAIEEALVRGGDQ